MNNYEETKLWGKFLDTHFCNANPMTGNRPCDNGCYCDRCHNSEDLWEQFKEENK